MKQVGKHIIVWFLVFYLLCGRVFSVEILRAQSDPAPTSEPAPTSVPSESQPEAQPTQPPAPSTEPVPSSEPAPTQSAYPEPTGEEPAPTSTPVASSETPGSSPFSSGATLTPTGSEQTSSGLPSETGVSSNTPSSSSPSAVLGVDPSGSINDPYNSATGPYSQNTAEEIVEKKLTELNTNLAAVENIVSALSSTGFNAANFNTFNSQVFTGDTIATANLLNKLNSNMTGTGNFSTFSVYDTHVGDLVFTIGSSSVGNTFDAASPMVSLNSLTGPGSTNAANAQDSLVIKEANTNDATLVNDIALDAITGENSASYNTGSGTVKTGDAFALANIVNLVNTNVNASQWLIGVINIFGTLYGDIVLVDETALPASEPPIVVSNGTTGPLSENTATFASTETNLSDTVSFAAIDTTINATANSGENASSYNTGGGSVTTGNTDVSVTDTTIANTTVTAEDDTVYLIIVNQMGQWVGHVFGLPWDEQNNYTLTVDPSSSSNTSIPPEVDISNGTTGPDSTNTSSYTTTSQESKETENTATITTTITANADSGHNEALYNTGGGMIETGDAKVGINLLNLANTTVTAKKFVALFVNVLGTFFGNVVSEQVPPPVPVEEEIGDDSSTTDPVDSPIGGTDAGVIPLAEGTTPTPIPVAQYILPEEEHDVQTTQTDEEEDQQGSQSTNQMRKTSAKKTTKVQKTVKKHMLGVSTAETPSKKYARGLFLSPKFAEATNATWGGMLFGGFKLKVNESWLIVVPVSILFYFLRRRRLNLQKYIHALFDLVL